MAAPRGRCGGRSGASRRRALGDRMHRDVVLKPHGELLNAGIATAVGAGFALIALWLCLILRRLGVMGGRGDGADGQGWGREPNDPSRPQPPSGGSDLWPEFERELRELLQTHERTPVVG
jgi:hypothetical protein